MMKIINRTDDLTNIDFQSGAALLIDKPYRWSSFKVIHILRKHIGIKKVGHAGTLDPLATGLLIVCTGKWTKKIDTFQALPKTYEGTFCLGKKTPTMDAESDVIEELPYEHITIELLNEKKKNFEGEINQIPPIYSAMNYKGKKLYEYARKGKEVPLIPRVINILNFEIVSFNPPEVGFSITCSKGTYIRSLANDFGNALGCGAYLSSLRRTAIGEYLVKDAFQINEIEEKLKLIKK